MIFVASHTFNTKLQCQAKECAVLLCVYHCLVEVTYHKLLIEKHKIIYNEVDI